MVESIKTQQEFEKNVLSSSGKVMVDFYADWCGPCKMFASVFDSFSEEYEGCAFFRVNVDEFSDVAASLGIDSIPCIIVFTGGKETARAVGAREKESLKAMIER